MKEKKYILTKEVAAEKLIRLALEIAEHLPDNGAVPVLVGIQSGGGAIAKKIQSNLAQYAGVESSILSLKFENKDLKTITWDQPAPDFEDKTVILVDDVCNSGKTIFYALKPFLETAPESIRTLVMVERLHKKFPIKSDFVGLTKATTEQDYIHVEIENDEIIGAYVDEIANYAHKK